jgi:hypothetical protein
MTTMPIVMIEITSTMNHHFFSDAKLFLESHFKIHCSLLGLSQLHHRPFNHSFSGLLSALLSYIQGSRD